MAYVFDPINNTLIDDEDKSLGNKFAVLDPDLEKVLQELNERFADGMSRAATNYVRASKADFEDAIVTKLRSISPASQLLLLLPMKKNDDKYTKTFLLPQYSSKDTSESIGLRDSMTLISFFKNTLFVECAAIL